MLSVGEMRFEDIGSAPAEKVGQGEVGGYVEKPWSPGGPFFSFPALLAQFRKLSSSTGSISGIIGTKDAYKLYVLEERSIVGRP